MLEEQLRVRAFGMEVVLGGGGLRLIMMLMMTRMRGEGGGGCHGIMLGLGVRMFDEIMLDQYEWL